MATLPSVNVGLPKDVASHGRTVHTGIWKRPVDGPLYHPGTCRITARLAGLHRPKRTAPAPCTSCVDMP